MKRIPIKERIAVLLLLAMLVTNPLTGQYVNLAIDIAFQQMFIYGAYISIVGSVYFLGLVVLNYIKNNKVNIPKPKAGTPKFIET